MLRRRIVLGVAAVVTIMGIAMIGWFVVWGPELRFASQAWKAEALYHWGPGIPPRGDNLRARMIGDLLSGHLQPGMSRGAVDTVLGESDAGGNGLAYYVLMPRPTWIQKAVAFVRWRATDPYLRLDFEGSYPHEELKRIRVGPW